MARNARQSVAKIIPVMAPEDKPPVGASVGVLVGRCTLAEVVVLGTR